MTGRPKFALIIIFTVTLVACNLPLNSTTPSSSDIETQVSIILTNSPSSPPTLTQSPPTLLPPTNTPQPSVINTATRTPTSTPPSNNLEEITSTVLTDPRQTLGPPSWTDSLDSNSNFFTTESPARFKSEVANGSLVITSYNPNGWHSWSLSYPRVTNFYLETSAIPGDCAELDRYGLIIRVPDPTQGYLFGLSCDGRYSFRKWDGTGFSNLINWTSHDAIQPGPDKSNRMGVMAQESTFSLYVNGILVGETNDKSYAMGTYGFFAAASSTPNFQVQFEDISYWNLP